MTVTSFLQEEQNEKGVSTRSALFCVDDKDDLRLVIKSLCGCFLIWICANSSEAE